MLKEIICSNPNCNFDISNSGLKISLDSLTKSGDDSNPIYNLRCPICNQINIIPIDQLGILYQKKGEIEAGTFIRWIGSEQDRPHADKADQVKIGKNFVLAISNLHNKLPNEISYPAIPVFAQKGGKPPRIPDIPIRKEFFRCIDAKALASLDKGAKPVPILEGGNYKIMGVPLQGLDAKIATNYVVPIMSSRINQMYNQAGSMFEGIELSYWPKIDYKEWNRFFIRLTANHESAVDFFNVNRQVKLFILNPEGQWDEAKKEKDENLLLWMTEQRPQWLAIEFYAPGSNPDLPSSVIGGGIFKFPEPAGTHTYEGSGTETIAIDFGTSNTCMAYKDSNGRTKYVNIKNINDSIIEGMEQDVNSFKINTWPLTKGFGAEKSFIPSELVTRKPLNELIARGNFESWATVMDFGIPQSDFTSDLSSEDHSIYEFKWITPTRGPLYQDKNVGIVQQKYLEYVLMMAIAQMAQSNAMKDSLTIRYSYPLAFKKEDRETLDNAFNNASKTLKKIAGLAEVIAKAGPNEASAAGALAGTALTGEMLFVDVGGGSTDIAYLARQSNITADLIYLTSVHFAGTALVNAISNECLTPGCTKEKLRRRIRDSRNVSEVLHSPDVVDTSSEDQIIRRIETFYSTLKEYIARLIAARLIVAKEEERKSFQNGFNLSIYFLGNGWGFGSFIKDGYNKSFAKNLTTRVKSILSEFDQSYDDKPAEYELVENIIINIQTLNRSLAEQEESGGAQFNEPIHPKAAVAFGLLAKNKQIISSTPGEWRKILGYDVTLEGKKYPWYHPLDNEMNAQYPSNEVIPKNQRIFDCPKDALPSFPDEELFNPYDIARDNLNEIRRIMSDELVKGNSEWFQRSPLEIMLENLYKPMLGTLI